MRAMLLPLTNGTTDVDAGLPEVLCRLDVVIASDAHAIGPDVGDRRVAECGEAIDRDRRARCRVAIREHADSPAVEQTRSVGPVDVREVDEILRRPDREHPRVGAGEQRARDGVDVDHRHGVGLGEPHRAVREVAGAEHAEHAIGGELVGDGPLVFDAGRAERAEHRHDRHAVRCAASIELGRQQRLELRLLIADAVGGVDGDELGHVGQRDPDPHFGAAPHRNRGHDN